MSELSQQDVDAVLSLGEEIDDDYARLLTMQTVAERILIDSDIPPDRWKCEVNWQRQLSVGVWRIGGGLASWSITVTKPNDHEKMGHAPAEPQIHGIWTPLCVRVVNALEALMWTDRET